MDIGARVKELRSGRGYTQEYVAEKLGVTRQAVSRWESGQSMPSTANLLALTELFGVQLLGEAADAGAEKRAKAARLAKRIALLFTLYSLLYGAYMLAWYTEGPVSFLTGRILNAVLTAPACLAVSVLALLAGWRRTAWTVLLGAAGGCAAALLWPTGPAGLFSGFVGFLICFVLGFAAGLVWDGFKGRESVFRHGVRQLEGAMIAAAMAISLVWLVYAGDRLQYISGADAGYLAGYEAALSGVGADGFCDSPYEGASQYDLGWRRYWQDGWHDAAGELTRQAGSH